MYSLFCTLRWKHPYIERSRTKRGDKMPTGNNCQRRDLNPRLSRYESFDIMFAHQLSQKLQLQGNVPQCTIKLFNTNPVAILLLPFRFWCTPYALFHGMLLFVFYLSYASSVTGFDWNHGCQIEMHMQIVIYSDNHASKTY